MKTKSKMIVAMLFITVWGYTIAQHTNDWAFSLSSTSDGFNSTACILDSVNNKLFITGTFDGTADFNPGIGVKKIKASNYGTNHPGQFLAIYDAVTSQLQSVTHFQPQSQATVIIADGIALSNNNSGVWVTGRLKGKIKVSNTIQSSKSVYEYDYFIAKFNNSGMLVKFAKFESLAPQSNSQRLLIKTDKSGNIFLVGGGKGKFDFNPSTSIKNILTLSHKYDIFIACFGSTLQIKYLKKIESFGNELLLSDIAVDPSKNIILTGSYKANNLGKDVDFNTATNALYSLPDPSAAYNKMGYFIAKYNSAGGFVFAKPLMNNSLSDKRWISTSTDYQGNIFLSGNLAVNENVDVDLDAPSKLVSGSGIFIAKYDKNGVFKYAIVDSLGFNPRITMDSKNNLYVITIRSFKPSTDWWQDNSDFVDFSLHVTKYNIQSGLRKYTFSVLTEYGMDPGADYGDVHRNRIYLYNLIPYKKSLFISGVFNGKLEFKGVQANNTTICTAKSAFLDFFCAKYTLSGSALLPEDIDDSINDNMRIAGSVFDGTDSRKLIVYPNPAKNELSIKSILTENTVLAIYNSNGVIVASSLLTEPESKIDITELPAGIYLIEVTGNNTREIKKIIKQ